LTSILSLDFFLHFTFFILLCFIWCSYVLYAWHNSPSSVHNSDMPQVFDGIHSTSICSLAVVTALGTWIFWAPLRMEDVGRIWCLAHKINAASIQFEFKSDIFSDTFLKLLYLCFLRSM